MICLSSPKVLVGAPTYEGKEYCRKEYFANLKNLDYDNYKICVVDNSRGTSYYKKLLMDHPGMVARVERGANSREAVVNSLNYLRQKVLDEGYDYLLIVETDLFPRSDVIKRLMSHDKPVVGAAYFIGEPPAQRVCVTVVDKRPDEPFAGTRLIKPSENPEWLGKGLKKVHGCGLGCVLIRRDVLEKVAFWYSSTDDLRGVVKHPDVYFYMTLWNEGIPVFLDTDYLVVHRHKRWTDDDLKDL